MLRVDDLHFGYGGKPVLRGVSFEVKRGELCGLFGPNGCGKTTLFRCCLKFLKVEKGCIRVNGTDISGIGVRELARSIAYVPQEHRSSFPYKVREMVLMGRTPRMGHGFGPGRRDMRIAMEALKMLGISSISERVFSELSGGQRQLVLIARAIAQGTGLIFLDEPTSALDFSNQIKIWKILREIAAQGVSIVACSHDPNHVAWFCDRIVILHEEGVLTDGFPDQTITQNVLDRIYSGVCMVKSVDGIKMVIPRDPHREKVK
ncbi:MAG: ABC transporter ATP-binding protein [Syntrophobacter sp.]